MAKKKNGEKEPETSEDRVVPRRSGAPPVDPLKGWSPAQVTPGQDLSDLLSLRDAEVRTVPVDGELVTIAEAVKHLQWHTHHYKRRSGRRPRK